MRALAFLLALAALMLSVVGSARAGEGPGAKALEARLLAPCCWGGTIDIHDSELARDLRHEVEDRIGRGESADAVEADLVGRYGAKMRALPNKESLGVTITALFAVFAASAIALGFYVRRLRASAKSSASQPAGPAVRDALDERLDAELYDL